MDVFTKEELTCISLPLPSVSVGILPRPASTRVETANAAVLESENKYIYSFRAHDDLEGSPPDLSTSRGGTRELGQMGRRQAEKR